MQAPGFWARPPGTPGLAARVLQPVAWIWAAMTRRRMARPPAVRLAVPVICVGNISVGGAGKTPTVMALIARLQGGNVAAHVVSRGHGGRLEGPLRVDVRRHSAADVGDEPLLLAALAPVWVGRDRGAAARAAAAAGAACIILDDGFQNPALAKDVSIVVIDAVAGFGNGRVVPAGPLREPVPDGLARADLVLILGSPSERAHFAHAWPAAGALPTLNGELRPLTTGLNWRGLRAVAFAGIARPEKMFATLRAAGAEVVAAHAFGDHAPYSPQMLARLQAEADRLGADLVTTEKDAVRLPKAFRSAVRVLSVRLEIADWAPLDAELARLGLGAARGE
jgi:tetraacyldisaccharide 4'-kinase